MSTNQKTRLGRNTLISIKYAFTTRVALGSAVCSSIKRRSYILCYLDDRKEMVKAAMFPSTYNGHKKQVCQSSVQTSNICFDSSNVLAFEWRLLFTSFVSNSMNMWSWKNHFEPASSYALQWFQHIVRQPSVPHLTRQTSGSGACFAEATGKH